MTNHTQNPSSSHRSTSVIVVGNPMDLKEHVKSRKGQDNREEGFQAKEPINGRIALESHLRQSQSTMEELKKEIEGGNTHEVRSNHEVSRVRENIDEVRSDHECNSDKNTDVNDDKSSIDPVKVWGEKILVGQKRTRR